MVRKQPLAVGGLSSLFSSSNKQQETSPTPGAVLMPCRHSSASSSMSSSSYSAWHSCGLHPRTLSFRQLQEDEDASRHGCQQQSDDEQKHAADCYYKTIMNNSVDSLDSSVDSFSTEAVLRAVRSDRLLLEPDEDASSFKAASSKPNKNKLTIKDDGMAAFGGAMAMSLESENPYRDFRESMESGGAVICSCTTDGDRWIDWRKKCLPHRMSPQGRGWHCE